MIEFFIKKSRDMDFYMNKDSLLPILRMELIEDGRHSYNKFFELIQSADITFTMINRETGVTKIAKAPAYIKEREDGGCVEQYVICYDWRKRDVNETGTFLGKFNIEFGEVKNDEYDYPKGNLIMPLREDLLITIK
jgi:hypothetical protein